jgi:hypothetical protein
MAFDSLLLVLAMIKATEYWRAKKFRGPRLVKVLITDQIVYFAVYVSFRFVYVFVLLSSSQIKGHNRHCLLNVRQRRGIYTA